MARPVYETLAEAFAAEGVDAQFTLMGDANMHWSTALKGMPGVRTYLARHEHCACSMAMGYHSATGKVGVASVTSGPGFTQIMTALTQAARCHIPLVVFAGEVPLSARWNTQHIDQPALTVPTGARYIQAHSLSRMLDHVRETFHTARQKRQPVVLGVPYDLQKQAFAYPGQYISSTDYLPESGRAVPDPAQVDRIAKLIEGSKRPLFVGGRGAVAAGAGPAIEALAERCGALLATTLPARGLFDSSPFGIGVAGGWARSIAHELAREADLVVSFGARNSMHTLDGGKFFPAAGMVQVNVEPTGLNEGLRTADLALRADAGLAAEALLDRLVADGWSGRGMRSNEIAKRIADEPADAATFDIDSGTLDPRDVFAELGKVIPNSFETVGGSGHQTYFHSVMRGYAAERYHSLRDFSAIGSSAAFAMGIAAARPDGNVVLFEGDGSFIMHIQELETARRHGFKLLCVIINDGAYGAELHKLRASGLDDSGARFGRTDFAAVARGFGLRGETVTDVAQFAPLFAEYQSGDIAAVWDVHVSDQVTTPKMRVLMRGEH